MRPPAAAVIIALSLSLTGCSPPTPTRTAAAPPALAPGLPPVLAPSPQTPPPPVLMVEIGDGVHEVGPDIQAGEYRTAGPRPGGIDVCFWSRLSGLGGTIPEVIATGQALGPTTVAINPSDKAFKTEYCQPWVRRADQP